MTFNDIPQFISDGSYCVNVSMEHLVNWIDQSIQEDGLQLCPDFQRGHVWTEDQQVKFLEFIFSGGKTGRTLYFNDPHWHGVHPKAGYSDFVCVDGLQRITAIQRFLNNEIRVFGQLYSEFGGKTDLMRHGMVININDLKTKPEVLQWYIQMNAGGTPHSPEEIQRVQKLMEVEKGQQDFGAKNFQQDTREDSMNDYQAKYLAEVSLRLQRAGFTVKPEEDGRLAVEQDSQRLCRVNAKGTVFYDQDTVADSDQALQQAIDIARMTSEYMRQMERAPELKATGLDGGYKLLGEFNDTVLAGRETRYGVNFITWSWDQKHTSLTDGHYHMENYAGAKQDFAVRSGAVMRKQIFTPEQLAEVYRSIHETLDSGYPITDARKELLEGASHQIEGVVPDLEQRVSQSNQQELELAQELEGGTEYEQGQSFAGL